MSDTNNARNRPGVSMRDCVARCDTLQDLDDLVRIVSFRARKIDDKTLAVFDHLIAQRRLELQPKVP